MKASGPGIFFVERFLIANSISLICMQLPGFSMPPGVAVGKLGFEGIVRVT